MTNSKANLKPTELDKIIEHERYIKRQFGLQRRNITGINLGASVTAGSGNSGQVSNNTGDSYLKVSGDTMIGPIAFYRYPTLAIFPTVANNHTLDISRETGAFSSHWIWSPDGSGSNRLEIIEGAIHSGQILVVESTQTVTQTIVDVSNSALGAGNIKTLNGDDLVLGTDKTLVMFMFSDIDSQWHQVSNPVVSAGSGMDNPATADLNMNNFDMVNVTDIGTTETPVNDLFVEQLRLKVGTVVTNSPMLTASGIDDMKINVNTGGKISFTVLNGEVGRVNASGFTTTFGIICGGALSAAGTLAATTTTVTSSAATTTITSNVTNIGLGAGTINLYDEVDFQNQDIIDINDVYCDVLRYRNDPTNTYIDLATGSGDIEIRTAGGTDNIVMQATGTGSDITLNASSSSSEVTINAGSGMFLQRNGSTMISITSNSITLGSFPVTLNSNIILNNSSDAGRGSAVTAGAGALFFNVSDGKINISNGTNWTLADGTIT